MSRLFFVKTHFFLPVAYVAYSTSLTVFSVSLLAKPVGKKHDCCDANQSNSSVKYDYWLLRSLGLLD